ncbi:MAG TPA: ferritin-like domain-containing protein [Candidatus Hypogeohydataceae bacterium YC41]
MDKKKIIEILNKALTEEMGALIQYMQHHYLYQGPNYVCVGELLKKISMVEMDHAYKLGERIAMLEGIPTTKPGEIKVPKKSIDMLKVNLEDELAAIENYRKWIEEVDALGDPVTRLMLEKILGDEEEHAHQLEMLLAE